MSTISTESKEQIAKAMAAAIKADPQDAQKANAALAVAVEKAH